MRKPPFLERPQAHLVAKRDSKSAADYACAVEKYERADDCVWMVDLFLAALLCGSIAGLVVGWLG